MRSTAALLLVLACPGLAVCQWREKATLRGHEGWVGGVAFSPDSKTLASASADRTVRLWRLGADKPYGTLSGHTDIVAAVAWAPDGRLLASGGFDHLAVLYPLTPKLTGDPSWIQLRGHRGVVMTVAFSPDGRALATGSIDGTVKLWDPDRQREKRTLAAHKSWVNAVAFLRDGRLATAGSDNAVRLWDAAGKQTAEFTVKEGEVRSLAVSPDDTLLAAGLRYGSVRVWDLKTLKERATLRAHAGDAWAVAFSPDGKTLVSGGGDWNRPGEVKLWAVGTWREAAALRHTGEVLCVAVAPDGKTIAAGSWDRTIKLWEQK
jgi:WD40 repeat protein